MIGAWIPEFRLMGEHTCRERRLSTQVSHLCLPSTRRAMGGGGGGSFIWLRAPRRERLVVARRAGPSCVHCRCTVLHASLSSYLLARGCLRHH